MKKEKEDRLRREALMRPIPAERPKDSLQGKRVHAWVRLYLAIITSTSLLNTKTQLKHHPGMRAREREREIAGRDCVCGTHDGTYLSC